MRKTMPIVSAALLTAIAIFLSIAAAYQVAARDQSTERRAVHDAPVVDSRRKTDRPPPALPELPDLSAIQPLTLEVTIQHWTAGKRAQTTRQTVARTADRVHIRVGKDVEWLLERNPVDLRRVAGALIDHRKRVIVTHDESDLRMALAINGWFHALTGGLDRQHPAPSDARRSPSALAASTSPDIVQNATTG